MARQPRQNLSRPHPTRDPLQDDDLSAQPTSSASPQPTLNETSTEPQAHDQQPWLLPQPDTRLFNIFGDSFELQALKEKIAKGQMPRCLYKDPAAVDQQPLNRQELWAAMQYKPIYRTPGKWTYWDLLPDDSATRLRTRPNSPRPPASNPNTCLPRLAPACRLNRLGRLRRTPGQMPQNRKRPPRLPQPPSQNQPRNPKPAASAATDPTAQHTASPAGTKPEPPPQQHLRPPESQTFLPKENEPLPKPMPAKPAQATQPPQGQPLPADRPGSSKDDLQDLSSTDPASIYKPLSGQDLHIDAFRSLDQPGAFTQPYLFDVDLLDRRAQPLYAQPHYKPMHGLRQTPLDLLLRRLHAYSGRRNRRFLVHHVRPRRWLLPTRLAYVPSTGLHAPLCRPAS